MLLAKYFDPFEILTNWENDIRRLTNTRSSSIANTDMYEKDDKLVVEVDIPGVDPKNIEVVLNKNILTVKGSIESKVKKDYWYNERQNSFTRSFTLPFSVDQEKVQALYDKGVLTILLNKESRDSPRKISVKSV